ncbi:class F sortase [Pseudonocardia bannensis]|uniref:Class F sortase n=1 Tax=Pseudonocardia bannensis TaxID=630973 RepID=A0A848DMS9_9PSEU|nr:class F sortase [Pseudonocardia bannensis]NMH93796.1 class F sortase [Pseudonocardia bannensis]
MSRRRWPAVLVACCGVICLATGVVLWPGDGSRSVEAADLGAVPAALGAGAEPGDAAAGPGAAPSWPGHVPADAGLAPPGSRPAPAEPAAAGSEPVELSLPGRGVTAPVVPVGADPAGALAVPDSPRTVGWWAPGALAGGAAGNVVIAGHVDSATAGVGVMAVLPSLVADEQVLLRGADGRTFAYRVATRRHYAKARLPAEVFARTGAPRLVLVTCGGRFDPGSRSYDDNIMVEALPART